MRITKAHSQSNRDSGAGTMISAGSFRKVFDRPKLCRLTRRSDGVDSQSSSEVLYILGTAAKRPSSSDPVPVRSLHRPRVGGFPIGRASQAPGFGFSPTTSAKRQHLES